jgi:hypothetical protein
MMWLREYSRSCGLAKAPATTNHLVVAIAAWVGTESTGAEVCVFDKPSLYDVEEMYVDYNVSMQLSLVVSLYEQ